MRQTWLGRHSFRFQDKRFVRSPRLDASFGYSLSVIGWVQRRLDWDRKPRSFSMRPLLLTISLVS